MYHHYSIPKYPLKKKRLGVYPHYALVPNDPLLRECDNIFWFPHSRHTEVKAEDILQNLHLYIIATSDEAGIGIVISEITNQVFITGI